MLIPRSALVVGLGASMSFGAAAGIAKAEEVKQRGIASVYSYSAQRTASGETMRPGALTAAHRTFRFGTKVRVTNRKSGRSVVVRINDRGPFVRGRIIDLTPAAAQSIDFSGLADVSLSIVR